MTEWICERLTDEHLIDSFTCGKQTLDDWLREWARHREWDDIGRTFVCHEGDDRVLAYFTLMAHQIEKVDLPEGKPRRQMPRAIPAVLLAKLAVHKEWQGHGHGRDVLIAAMERVLDLAEVAGCRYLIVDALDEEAATFYERHEFQRIPDQSSLRLAILVNDVRETLAAGL